MPRHPLCALHRLIAGIEYSCSSTTPRLFACQSCCNVLFLEYLISRAVLLCRLKIRALRRALHRLHLQSLDATLAFSDCQGSGVLRQPNRGARQGRILPSGKKASRAREEVFRGNFTRPRLKVGFRLFRAGVNERISPAGEKKLPPPAGARVKNLRFSRNG